MELANLIEKIYSPREFCLQMRRPCHSTPYTCRKIQESPLPHTGAQHCHCLKATCGSRTPLSRTPTLSGL